MSGYEVEHNIPATQEDKAKRGARPDLSTFFSELTYVDTSSVNSEHARPEPDHVSALHRLLAEAFTSMLVENESLGANLNPIIEELRAAVYQPPDELDGVPDSFLDELERVSRKSLKPSDTCAICGNAFLDEQYILVVRLPCHKDHIFDMECIRPWLKLKSTCPLDRQVIYKKKSPPPPKQDDDEEEWDDMYA